MQKTYQKEDYKSFYLKKKTWEAICSSRGWHGRGSITRFAEEIGVTRQYASGLVSGACGCSSNVMRKIIGLLGINKGCWCHLFEKNSTHGMHPNHPIVNQAKFMGEVPYQLYSPSAGLRSADYETEEKDHGRPRKK
jgi:hypothetical protein